MVASAKRIDAWSKAPARSLHVYGAAALAGLAAYLLVYGAGHLFGTSAYWQLPEPDERMAMMGYRYFLHEPWHWPVFVNHAVNVPYPKSVAFLDCIPIWAFVNKAIATIVPPWGSFSEHAYLGLWHGVAYALQPCFGVAIVRLLGHRSWRAALVTVAFFVALPTWIFRYGHPALSAHWIELWAVYLYLRTPARSPTPRRINVAKLCQLVVASMVSPYPAVMSLLIFIVSVLRSRDRRTIASWLPLGLAAVAVATWFSGYVARETLRDQWGFEFESANLLSWLIPPRSGIIGDAQWIASVSGTDWQYEGYAYLGIGFLLLLVLFLPHVRTLAPTIRRHPHLFALVAACCLFSLSNHIYFGSHELVSVPIPSVLKWIPRQFRSPGRFVWIPTYVLLVYVLHRSLASVTRGRGFALIAVAAIVQVVDATGDWRLQRTYLAMQSPRVDQAGWRALVDAHDAVTILPPYNCVLDDASKLDEVSRDIQWLASEHATPINGTYSARAFRQCKKEQEQWATQDLHPRTLYVLLPAAAAVADRYQAEGASCGMFDFGRVCSANASAIENAKHANVLGAPPEAVPFAFGTKLELATTVTSGAGWSTPDAGGRWTNAPLASIVLKLDGDPPATVDLKLQAHTLFCGPRKTEDVDVLLDTSILGTLHIDQTTNDPASVRTIAITDRDALRRGVVTIQLRPHHIRPPTFSTECGDDARRLGIHVSRLWFE
jgi:hypothetical protein